MPDEADPVVDTTATVDADGNVEVEDEPLSDDKLNRVLKNVVLGYSKYSGDKIKALTDKRLLRNLSELADKLKSEEGYEEYPILIKRALDKESSGLAKNRAKEKLIDKGGIDKIIAKAREVLGAAQAAPEVTPRQNQRLKLLRQSLRQNLKLKFQSPRQSQRPLQKPRLKP